VGRSNHGEGALPLEVLGTAAPFVLGASALTENRNANGNALSFPRR
jgi:hypothetical protein